ncbi:MAG: type 4a pilus biogenesis protein PilO [Deltaproteobacteria bacterium]|nr:type 4a pilus biogenesis protein PilO [Deltaproteobacteria bacterium]
MAARARWREGVPPIELRLPKFGKTAAPRAGDKQTSSAGRLKEAVLRFFKEKPLVAWLVVALALVVIYIQVGEPLLLYLDTLGEQTKASQELAANYRQILEKERQAVAQSRSQFAALTDKAEAAGAKDPTAVGKKLQAEISQLAQTQGLVVQRIRLLPPRPLGDFSQVSVRLEAQGTLPQIMAFFQQVELRPDLLSMSRFRLDTGGAAPGGQLNLESDLTTLMPR